MEQLEENSVVRTTVEVNNTNIYVEYAVRNKSVPTLVFLHDSLGCTELWRDFPSALAGQAGFNYMVYDRQGYGKSSALRSPDRKINYMHDEAELLLQLLDQLQIKEPILFGHSDGGSVALIAAALYPERIRGLICEAAHIFVEEKTLAGIRSAMYAFAKSDLSERLLKYHGDKVKDLFAAWTDTWTREDFRNWNIEALLPQIKCPLLFIQGDGDEYGTLLQVERTIALTGGKAEKCILPGTGHTPHREEREQTLQASVDFLSRTFGTSR